MANNFLKATLFASALLIPSSLPAAPLEALHDRLAREIPGSAVKIVEYAGITIVKGTVITETDRADAARIVREEGHARVANLIRVVRRPTDDEVRQNVEKTMDDLTQIGLRDISVRTADGVVWVGGAIAPESFAAVTDTIARVPGVTQVVVETRQPQR